MNKFAQDIENAVNTKLTKLAETGFASMDTSGRTFDGGAGAFGATMENTKKKSGVKSINFGSVLNTPQ
jgi:hypothetical protein